MLTFILNNESIKTVLNSFAAKFSNNDQIAISEDRMKVIFEHFTDITEKRFCYNKISGLNETNFSVNSDFVFKVVFPYSDFIKALKIYKNAEYIKITVYKTGLKIEDSENGTISIYAASIIHKDSQDCNILEARKGKNAGNYLAEISVTIPELLTAIEKTVCVIPDFNYRIAITGLNFHIKSDSDLNYGKTELQATDSHRAIITDLFCEKYCFYGCIDQNFIIPKNAVNGILKIMKNFKKSQKLVSIRFYYDYMELYFNDNKICFSSGLIEDCFPDIKKIIPDTSDHNAMILNLPEVSREFLESFVKNSGKNDKIIFTNDPEYSNVVKIINHSTNRELNLPVEYILHGKWQNSGSDCEINLPDTAFKANYLLECIKFSKNHLLNILWSGLNTLKITDKVNNTITVISRIVLQ